MQGGTADPVAVLRSQLVALYDAARRPPYRQLEVEAARENMNLAPSTTGDLLTGTGTPRWSTVEAFVRAITRHVRARRIALPEDRLDLDRWHGDYAAMEGALAGRTRGNRAAKSPRRARTGVPAQLPADVTGFTGRDEELAALDKLLSSRTPGAGIVVCAIAGTAGVGKTALAVHWAHRVRDQFPDGQLYVNLRGFDAAEQVMEPAEAIRGFLAVFGVPAKDVPAAPDAQAALYRSLLVDRRVLVILDNARDSAQVRPLLPGSPGCAVVVTSRSQLTGLVAVNHAQPLPLNLMSVTEAREFLRRRLGADRVAAEAPAVDELIDIAARLPLALAIVAARAITSPRLALDEFGAQLRDVRARLDILTGDDPATNLRAVFSWSSQTLSDGAARLFRLLGLHPGPDLSAPAAASLAALPESRVRPLLRELVDAHIVEEHRPGRYTFHDLLRVYAAEEAQRAIPEDERAAATQRMFDHYLHTATRADDLMNPPREAADLDAAEPGVTPEEFRDRTQAMDWLVTEHRVLVAAVEFAAASGWDRYVWQLAWTLIVFLDSHGYWQEWVSTQTLALAAAERQTDSVAQARAHRILGVAYLRLSRYDDAYQHFQLALAAYGRAGDNRGQAHTHVNLGGLMGRQNRYSDVLAHAQEALHLYRSVDDAIGIADSLNGVGWAYGHLEEYEQALSYSQQALSHFQQIQAPYREADVWNNLGYLYTRLRRYDQAIAAYQQAIQLFRDQADRYFEAKTLIDLGDTHQAAGDPSAAATSWQQALTILTELDHADVERVRAKLRTVS